MNLEELEQAYARQIFPQEGERYWYYDQVFRIQHATAYYFNQRMASRTDEEAQQAAEIEKAKVELKRTIEELNDDWVPDFSLKVNKFYLYFDAYDQSLQIDLAVHERCQPSWMYLKSANLAQRLIEDHSELLKIVLSE